MKITSLFISLCIFSTAVFSQEKRATSDAVRFASFLHDLKYYQLSNEILQWKDSSSECANDKFPLVLENLDGDEKYEEMVFITMKQNNLDVKKDLQNFINHYGTDKYFSTEDSIFISSYQSFINGNIAEAFSVIPEEIHEVHQLIYLKGNLKQLSKMNKRKKWLGVLIGLVPAAGKFYVGYPGDGTFQFLSIAATGVLAYRGFSLVGIKSVPGWMFGFISSGMYLGSMVGAPVSLDRKRHSLNIRCRDIYAKYYVENNIRR